MLARSDAGDGLTSRQKHRQNSSSLTSIGTAPSASRMTRMLLVALSVAGRRAQREPPWRQKFKLTPLRAERRRHLALVWENYGTRPTRCSRHPGDIPVGLDPQLSISKKTTAAIPPPRLHLTKACDAFLKSVAPHVSVGHAAMDYEINRQMLLEAQKFPGGWVQWPGRWAGQ